MNHWQQTKQYRCPRCGAAYLHDKAYGHQSFLCPFRFWPMLAEVQTSAQVNP